MLSVGVGIAATALRQMDNVERFAWHLEGDARARS